MLKKEWFGLIQGNKIVISSELLRHLFACFSRGLRRQNAIKNNTTSTVYVAQIIVKVAELAQEGLSVFIRWKYDEYDEEMLDLGEKLSSISKLPIDYVPVKDED